MIFIIKNSVINDNLRICLFFFFLRKFRNGILLLKMLKGFYDNLIRLRGDFCSSLQFMIPYSYA